MVLFSKAIVLSASHVFQDNSLITTDITRTPQTIAGFFACFLLMTLEFKKLRIYLTEHTAFLLE